ncbi:hypothetical protein [Arthrobacter sp. USHLN218]|uniref:hypothetical protein n=1 Tax=Arthrobacter sp. USHLN218 TaxID=3081232 RepID=UPI00301B055B
MMKKLLFGAGLATGFILGSRAGRGSYDQLAGAVGRIWRARTGPAAGPSGRRSAGSVAPADAVRAAPAQSGAARVQSGAADAAARSGQAPTDRRVGPDPSMDDRPGSEWSGGRAAGSVETVGDPEEELGHS